MSSRSPQCTDTSPEQAQKHLLDPWRVSTSLRARVPQPQLGAEPSPDEQLWLLWLLWLLISHNLVALLSLFPSLGAPPPHPSQGKGKHPPGTARSQRAIYPMRGGDLPDPEQPRTAAPASLPQAAPLPPGSCSRRVPHFSSADFPPPSRAPRVGLKASKTEHVTPPAQGCSRKKGKGRWPGEAPHSGEGMVPGSRFRSKSPAPGGRPGRSCAAEAPHSCSAVPERSIRSRDSRRDRRFPRPPQPGVTSARCHHGRCHLCRVSFLPGVNSRWVSPLPGVTSTGGRFCRVFPPAPAPLGLCPSRWDLLDAPDRHLTPGGERISRAPQTRVESVKSHEHVTRDR